MNNSVKGNNVLYPINIVFYSVYHENYKKKTLFSVQDTLLYMRKLKSKTTNDPRLIFKEKFVVLKRLGVIDSANKNVNLDYLYNLAFDNWKPNKKFFYYEDIFFGFKRSFGSYYRRPKTLNELRESGFSYYDPELNLSEPKARGKRRKGYLVTSWDDLHRCRNHNWKEHRKNRWKE